MEMIKPSRTSKLCEGINLIALDLTEPVQVCVDRSWGQSGSPWEFNLRDITRWCGLLKQYPALSGTQESCISSLEYSVSINFSTRHTHQLVLDTHTHQLVLDTLNQNHNFNNLFSHFGLRKPLPLR